MGDILNETPTLQKVIEDSILTLLSDVHTSMPGIIVNYDETKKTADIRPALRKKYISENSPIDLPVIPNVQIGFFQTNDSIISIPLKKDDEVLLIFSERSLDKWKSSGGIVSPDDQRKHALADAIAFPMIKPIGKGIPADPDDILIKNGEAEIKVKSNGKFEIKNTTQELLDVIDQLMDKIIEGFRQLGEVDTTNTVFGAMQPNNFLIYQLLKSDVTTIKSKLAELKV